MRYAVLREDEPGTFKPTGDSFEAASVDQAADRVMAMQADDAKHRCHAAQPAGIDVTAAAQVKVDPLSKPVGI